jgi:hypothetical protein
MVSHGIFDDFEAEITGDKINGLFKAVGRYRSWIGQYKDKKKVGKWVYFNNVKNITKTMYFNDDKLQGLYELVSQTKIVRVSYDNNQMHGTYIKHNFKNSTSTIGHYNHGLRCGNWTKRDVFDDTIIYHMNYKIVVDTSVLHGLYIDRLYEGAYDRGVKIGKWVHRDGTEVVIYDGTGMSYHTTRVVLYQRLGGVCHGFYIINPLTEKQEVLFYHLGKLKKTPPYIGLVVKNDKYRLTFMNEFDTEETIEFARLE